MSRTVVLVLCLAACSKESAPKPEASVRPGVSVWVDDQKVATIDAARLETWPRLDAIVPQSAQRLGTWESIGIVGTAPQQLDAPADRYPSLVPALYPGTGGPALGMFDIIALSQRTPPKVSMPGVREIRIKLAADSDRGMNEEGTKEDFDPKNLVIAIEGGKQPTLTGTQIIALPRELPPNGDAATTGWTLVSLLRAAGIENPKELLLTDPNGTPLTLTAAQLDPAVSVPYVKLNRVGALRFRVYVKQGDGWSLGGNLRGIASIKVIK